MAKKEALGTGCVYLKERAQDRVVRIPWSVAYGARRVQHLSISCLVNIDTKAHEVRM